MTVFSRRNSTYIRVRAINQVKIHGSEAADAQTTQITVLMAAMIDQRMPTNTNNARRNSARQGGNRRGKKSGKKK